MEDDFDRYIDAVRGQRLSKLGLRRDWVRATGPYLFERDGTRTLDMGAGFSVFAFGRNHPAIRAALQRAMDDELPSLVQPDCPALAGDLARELVHRAPRSIARVWFTNSGAEAIETAIKLARKATGRERMVYCAGAFHGLTTGALALNGSTPIMRAGVGQLLSTTEVPFHDLAALERELARGDVAAFVIEPVQGKAMCAVSDEFLRNASELCRAHGSLLIADEVQSGIGRTGAFFACQHAGVEPDLITCSKILSGGFIPVGACLYSQAVYDRVLTDGVLPLSGTYKENAFAMTAGLATLRELDRGDYLARVRELSQDIREQVERLRSKHERIGEIRGRGLMMGIEIRGEPSEVVRDVCVRLLTDEHVLVQPLPFVCLTPPYVLSNDDVAWFIGALDRVLSRR